MKRSDVVKRALEVARRLKNPYQQAKSLRQLADGLPEGERPALYAEALEALSAVEEPDDTVKAEMNTLLHQRATALLSLRRSAPSEEQEAALKAALEAVEPLADETKIELLVRLVAQLPPDEE